MEKTRHVLRLDKLPRLARKIIVGLAGGVLFAAGVVMIFTPGPAVILIPLGLLLMASEFKFAEHWANKAVNLVYQLRRKWRERKRRHTRAA